MSAAELAAWLRNGAVPGVNLVERNGWNAGTKAAPYRKKQAALEGETALGTAGTGGTDIFAEVGRSGEKSRPEQAQIDDAQAHEPAPAADPNELWRQADRAYLGHHFGCRTCCSAGKGYGRRCPTGLDLWIAYEAACDTRHAHNATTRGRNPR